MLPPSWTWGSLLAAAHYSDVRHPRVASAEARNGQAAVSRHLQEWPAASLYTLRFDQHLDETFRIGPLYRIYIPTNTTDDGGHVPFQRHSRQDAYDDGYIWHIRVLWKYSGYRALGKCQDGLAGDEGEMERQDTD